MRVLFLCHRFPLPAEGGGKIRALHILRHLSASGHEVTLCSLIRSTDEARAANEIASLGIRVESIKVRAWVQVLRMLLYLLSWRPSSFGFFWSQVLARRVDVLLSEEQWDLIFVHCSSMGPYVSAVRGAPKVMDFVDMDSQKWLDYAAHRPFPASALYLLEGKKLEKEEARLARCFEMCTAISMNELETLNGYETNARTDWFPNGVDADYFAPNGEVVDYDLIAFMGRMDYYPNEQAMQWFCDGVWPRLRSRRNNLKLRIVGANPPRSVRRLENIGGVDVTGSVPDVRPYVRQAVLSIAPLEIARGMQNKVLESMAMGVPVIASERVARGLGLAGRESPLLVASTVDDYVERILSIIEQPEERERLSIASRRLMQEEYSWTKAMQRLDAIIEFCRPKDAYTGAG